MAAIPTENVSPYHVYGRPQMAMEDIAPFLAGSGDPNALVKPSDVSMSQEWARRNEPNAPSSGNARASNAYRSESGWLEDALSAFVAVDEEHAPESDWLAEALAALEEVDDEIVEEELPPVDGATKTEAGRIIKALARRRPLAPTIYPTQDAEIAIHFKSPDRPDVVVILLNNSGQANCYAYIDERGRRAHYDTSSDLPDAFVLDQLLRLTPPGRAAVSTPDAGFHLFGTMSLLTNLLRTQ